MATRPDSREAAGRLLALRSVITHALAAPPRELLEGWLREWSEAERTRFAHESQARSDSFWRAVNSSPISGYLSPWEREFSRTTVFTMSSQQQIDALWRLEAAHVLIWALQLVPGLPAPDVQSDVGVLKLEALSRPASFLDSARLRPEAEINHAPTLPSSGIGAAVLRS